MRNRKALLGWLIAIFLSGGALAGTYASNGSDGDSGTKATREQILTLASSDSLAGGRMSLGFAGDSATVQGLLNDASARAGFLKTGLLLSASERSQFDKRIALGDAVKGFVGDARGDKGFAGARLEHRGDGIFHIYLTTGTHGNALLSTLRSELPGDLDIRYHRVTYSEASLAEKKSDVWDVASSSERGENGLHTIMLDVENNGLIVEIDESVEHTTGPKLAARIERALGDIPVRVIYSNSPEDLSCTYTSCADPMAGGILINRGFANGPQCSLGFMVKDGNNTQAMASGHCGYVGNYSWYHSAYGSSAFGAEMEKWAYDEKGIDAMIVEIPENQGSNHVASCVSDSDICVDILGYYDSDDIYKGMMVNAIGGVSGHLVGTVSSQGTIEWTSATCDCIQYGISLNMSGADFGDSGGIIRRMNDAVAIIAAGEGSTVYAAIVDDILSAYGVSLRTS